MYNLGKRLSDKAALEKYEAQNSEEGSIAMNAYIHGDWTQENTAARLARGKDELVFSDGSGKKEGWTAQTTQNGKGGRIIEMRDAGNVNNNAIQLGHEAYRDGITGNEQQQETWQAVLGHTVMAAKMQAGGKAFDTSGLLGAEMEAYKRGDLMGLFMNSQVNYDSSADYWKLTKDVNLIDDGDGWLKDENGLYINKDGTRTAERTVNTIGSDGIMQGLANILNVELSHAKTLVDSYEQYSDANRMLGYNAYNDLFMRFGKGMEDVVYQAFQINKGYQLGTNDWAETPYGNHFTSFGRDEANIPIITTRIGESIASNNLVIAGIHGDEQIARSLILQSQRFFEQSGVGIDESIYFIPGISMTTQFADARGIPYSMLENGSLKGDPQSSISSLYNWIAGSNRKNVDSKGVNTNRDANSILQSTQNFLAFMIDLNNNLPTGGNIAIMMIHGYENAAAGDNLSGAVYPQYTLANTGKSVEMTPSNEALAKIYREALGWGANNQTQGFLFGATRSNPDAFAGEYIRTFAEMGIHAFDIELPQAYNEGYRHKEGDKYNMYPIWTPQSWDTANQNLNSFIGKFNSFVQDYWRNF